MASFSWAGLDAQPGSEIGRMFSTDHMLLMMDPDHESLPFALDQEIVSSASVGPDKTAQVSGALLRQFLPTRRYLVYFIFFFHLYLNLCSCPCLAYQSCLLCLNTLNSLIKSILPDFFYLETCDHSHSISANILFSCDGLMTCRADLSSKAYSLTYRKCCQVNSY